MATKSGIRWTTSTWNPIAGCSKVSPGCAHCYAETLSLRYGRSTKPWTPENAVENVVFHPERLPLPLRWPADPPRRIFVNSMSDLFHELAPLDYIARVFAVMARAETHTFQALTKRPERMAEIVNDPAFVIAVDRHLREATDVPPSKRKHLEPMELGSRTEHGQPVGSVAWPLPNVWLGTSIENDRFARRADPLRQTPAAFRFISAEPLLGPLPSLDLTGIHWLIVGGESGPGYRPMDHAWAADLRDRAVDAGVAYFFKQSAAPVTERGVELEGRRWEQYPDDADQDPYR